MENIFTRHTAKVALAGVVACCMALPAFCDEGKETSTRSLTLQEAITIAYAGNIDIRLQEEALKDAGAGITEARSGLLPSLDLESGYTRNAAVIPFSVASKKDMGVFTGYKNDNRLNVNLTQPVYEGGKNLLRLRQAQVSLRVQEETLRAKKLSLAFEVKRLYYGLALAYETERIARELLALARAHYEEVKMNFAQGTSSRFDVLQSKVHVAKLLPQLVNAHNSRKLIAAELAKVLGIDLRERIKPKDSLSFRRIDIQEEEFVKEAYLSNPQFSLKALGVDFNRQQIDLARAASKPSVEAAVSYGYRSNSLSDMINARHNNWNAGITVRIPIFDGFAAKAKVEQAKARYAQARLQKDDLGRQVGLAIHRACLDLANAQSLIDSQNESVEEAREAVRIAEISYANGVGTNLDVLDSQVSLSQIEQNLSEFRYDYLMARADLDQTIGIGIAEEK